MTLNGISNIPLSGSLIKISPEIAAIKPRNAVNLNVNHHPRCSIKGLFNVDIGYPA